MKDDYDDDDDDDDNNNNNNNNNTLNMWLKAPRESHQPDIFCNRQVNGSAVEKCD